MRIWNHDLGTKCGSVAVAQANTSFNFFGLMVNLVAEFLAWSIFSAAAVSSIARIVCSPQPLTFDSCRRQSRRSKKVMETVLENDARLDQINLNVELK
mmetsp:Transcript_25867/g.62312  ORF Transcript_25867/g.62312 Transcript_25867/m.62312 type:complete len:98 (-) Transcript_25867:142-435(-)